MSGVLSESVASKVLPLDNLINEGDTEGPFVFPPPNGAGSLSELQLDKETFFLLIGALTQENPADANMALSFLCRDHLDKPSLETLCVRLFAALQQVQAEKDKKAHRRSARSIKTRSIENRHNSDEMSTQSVDEYESVWDRLSRPVGSTPRDLLTAADDSVKEFTTSKLTELTSTLPVPHGENDLSETPRKVLLKTEKEAKEIFNRLYCDAAKWKVRRRVYTELALMAEDAKVAKECPFQPKIRKAKSDIVQDDRTETAMRLYEDSKSRTARREELFQTAPLPTFRPETSRSSLHPPKTPVSSGEKPYNRLHKDAARYREMRQNMSDYQLGDCTFKPDTARSQGSGPKISGLEPIWKRQLRKPAPKVEAKPKILLKRRSVPPTDLQKSDSCKIEIQKSEDEFSTADACMSADENMPRSPYVPAAQVEIAPLSTSDQPPEPLHPFTDAGTSSSTEQHLQQEHLPHTQKSGMSPHTQKGGLSPQILAQTLGTPIMHGMQLTQNRSQILSVASTQMNAGMVNRASTDRLEEHKVFTTQRQLSYRITQPDINRILPHPMTPLGLNVRQTSAGALGYGSAEVRLAPHPMVTTQYVARPNVGGVFYR